MATAKATDAPLLRNTSHRTFIVGPPPRSKRKAGQPREVIRVFPADAKSSDGSPANITELTKEQGEALKGNLAFTAVLTAGVGLERA